jgi:hypothetical protein
MPHRPATPVTDPRPVLWIGPVVGTELTLAADWLTTLVPLVMADGIAALDRVATRPWLVVLACHRPALWSIGELNRVATALPLVPLVAVTTSLAEGSRRNGDGLPGVEEIPWLELPGRMWGWCQEPRPVSIALPATSRRDERWLAQVAATPVGARRPVTVAAGPAAREPLCDLIAAAGWIPQPLSSSRPAPGCRGPVVWDAGGLGADGREWLRLLTADGRRDVLVMESFPRGDAVGATLAAGAAAVLPRVVGAEVLAGTLGWMMARGGARPPSVSALGGSEGGR